LRRRTEAGAPDDAALHLVRLTPRMALKSTIYKAALQVADMDRNYYADHALTIACHPSETPERMMVRVLAYALNAHERLAFGKGLSDVEDPDLSVKDLTGRVELWIEVGLPDEKTVLKACGRADAVKVYAYGSSAYNWWKQTGPKLERARNLAVVSLATGTSQALGKLATRTMQLQCTIQDGEIWMRDDHESVQVALTTLKE
jgi:uncharacterized protein YaeQ